MAKEYGKKGTIWNDPDKAMDEWVPKQDKPIKKGATGPINRNAVTNAEMRVFFPGSHIGAHKNPDGTWNMSRAAQLAEAANIKKVTPWEMKMWYPGTYIGAHKNPDGTWDMSRAALEKGTAPKPGSRLAHSSALERIAKEQAAMSREYGMGSTIDDALAAKRGGYAPIGQGGPTMRGMTTAKLGAFPEYGMGSTIDKDFPQDRRSAVGRIYGQGRSAAYDAFIKDMAGQRPTYYQNPNLNALKQFGGYAKTLGSKFMKTPLGKVGLPFLGGAGTALMLNDILDWKELNDIRTRNFPKEEMEPVRNVGNPFGYQ